MGSYGGSHDGVWFFDSSTENWQLATEDGPSRAGASAAVEVDSQRLIVCLGLERRRFRADDFPSSTGVFDLRMQRWDWNAWQQNSQLEDSKVASQPCSRRNAASAALGHRLIISGGYSDSLSGTVGDTWVLNMRSGHWTQISERGSPELEGHKAVFSGLDLFTFGGHSAHVTSSKRGMSVHMLALGREESPNFQDESEESDDSHGNSDDPRNAHLPRLLAQQPRQAGEYTLRHRISEP